MANERRFFNNRFVEVEGGQHPVASFVTGLMALPIFTAAFLLPLCLALWLLHRGVAQGRVGMILVGVLLAALEARLLTALFRKPK